MNREAEQKLSAGLYFRKNDFWKIGKWTGRDFRARICRRLMTWLERKPRRLYARLELQLLLWATARGFRQKSRWILFYKDPLASYADFSVSCMEDMGTEFLTKGAGQAADHVKSGEASVHSGGTMCQAEASARLFRISYQLGYVIRKVTGFTRQEDLQRLVFLLYRYIGITMRGQIPGRLVVGQCFFAEKYGPEQCRFISAMDAGIIGGIFAADPDAGLLQFEERITEGCGQCLACFEKTNTVKEA